MSKYVFQGKTYNIEIDGSALSGPISDAPIIEFEKNVKDMLDAIMGRQVGQQVIGKLPKDKTVRIVPRTVPGGPFVADACNAEAAPTLSETKLDSTIRIDPKTWKPLSECTTNPTGSAGTGADEILLHELLHAYHQLSGSTRKEPCNVEPEKHYDTLEEFWAIVVTNIYMSEKGKTLLRRDHANFAPLAPEKSTSVGFLNDADLERWSKAILNQEGPLLRAIDASISAATRFNPFHELLTHPEKHLRSDLADIAGGGSTGPGPTP